MYRFNDVGSYMKIAQQQNNKCMPRLKSTSQDHQIGHIYIRSVELKK
jgi:hypothetical protein